MLGRARLALAFLAAVLLTAALAPFQLVAIRTGWYSAARLPRLWHRLMHPLLGFRIAVHGAPATGRPLLIVANHVSWTDIVLFGAAAEVSFIAKSEMAGWPGFGWLAKLQRSVFVERDRRGSSGRQASEIARRMAVGDAMLLFAEGTTSDGNAVLPFKSTLFGAVEGLLKAGTGTILVQPAAIDYRARHGLPLGWRGRGSAAWIGDQALMPHLVGVVTGGGFDVDIIFGEAVSISLPANRKALARDTERAVRTLLRARRGPDACPSMGQGDPA